MSPKPRHPTGRNFSSGGRETPFGRTVSYDHPRSHPLSGSPIVVSVSDECLLAHECGPRLDHAAPSVFHGVTVLGNDRCHNTLGPNLASALANSVRQEQCIPSGEILERRPTELPEVPLNESSLVGKYLSMAMRPGWMYTLNLSPRGVSVTTCGRSFRLWTGDVIRRWNPPRC